MYSIVPLAQTNNLLELRASGERCLDLFFPDDWTSIGIGAGGGLPNQPLAFLPQFA